VAKYKHPAHVIMVKELPLTATMKVKKADLKKKYADTKN
jgi:fatty-acyl-CoA synthase